MAAPSYGTSSTAGTAAPARTRAPSARQPPLVCAEIWGGNRPVYAELELPGMRGWVYSRPCDGGRGGDIHYVSICSSGLQSRLCLADVAGHGEPVARVSGAIHRLLRRYMNAHDERHVLAGLNQALDGDVATRMTTAAALSYLAPLRRLAVSYAGHPPGWLYRARERRWERLELPRPEVGPLVNLQLAIDRTTSFSRRKLRVRPGDQVVLLTDGVLEAPSPAGALFGEAAVEAVLRECGAAEPGRLVKFLMAAVLRHTGGNLAHDDVTVLAVQFAPGPHAFGLWELVKNRVLGPRTRAAVAMQ